MKRSSSLFVVLSFLAITGRTHAFNAWGIRSGMTEKEVAAIATQQGYVATPPTDVTSHYENVAFLQHDASGQITGGYLTSFCRDRLIYLGLTYKSSVDTLIDLLKSLTADYGIPEALVKTEVMRDGLVRQLAFRFAPRPNDTTGINVISDPGSSIFTLQVTHSIYSTAVPCR